MMNEIGKPRIGKSYIIRLTKHTQNSETKRKFTKIIKKKAQKLKPFELYNDCAKVEKNEKN